VGKWPEEEKTETYVEAKGGGLLKAKGEKEGRKGEEGQKKPEARFLEGAE